MSDITVKRRDTHDIVFTVTDENDAPVDLTGATVRLLARRQGAAATVILGSSVSNPAAGEVTHSLTGTLEIGVYDVEVESTRNGDVVTAPNDGYFTVEVIEDLA